MHRARLASHRSFLQSVGPVQKSSLNFSDIFSQKGWEFLVQILQADLYVPILR